MKIKSFINKHADTLNITTVCLLSWLGVYLFDPKMGFISTLPIILFCAVGCAFIKIKPQYTATLFFVFALILRIADGNGTERSLLIAGVCAVFSLLSYLAVYIIKSKMNRPLCAVLTTAVALACLTAHVYLNDNPVSNCKRASALNEYIEEHYADEPMTAEKPFYCFDTKKYAVVVSYNENPTDTVEISEKNGLITDNYISLAEEYLQLEQATNLTLLLRKAFDSDSFYVLPAGILDYPRGNTVSAEDKTDYTVYSSYSVYFTNALTASGFAAKAEEYFKVILNSGFICRTLNFYCGSKGKFYVTLSTPLISMKNDFKYLINEN